MKRIRFNIANLLVIIFVLGVGFAAVREATDLWDAGIFTLTLVFLSVSVLLAIDRRESGRAFWIGFALFGWIYLGLTLVPSIESRLITTRGLVYLDSKVPRPTLDAFADIDYVNRGTTDLFVTNNSRPNTLYYVDKGNGTFEDVTPAAVKLSISNIFLGTSPTGSSGTTENFVRIGHSLVALIAAFLGGLISRYFFAKSRVPDSGPVNPEVCFRPRSAADLQPKDHH